jgi:hypothetical protein
LRTGLTTGVPLSKETEDDIGDRARRAPVIMTSDDSCLTSGMRFDGAPKQKRSSERRREKATRAPRRDSRYMLGVNHTVFMWLDAIVLISE